MKTSASEDADTEILRRIESLLEEAKELAATAIPSPSMQFLDYVILMALVHVAEPRRNDG